MSKTFSLGSAINYVKSFFEIFEISKFSLFFGLLYSFIDFFNIFRFLHHFFNCVTPFQRLSTFLPYFSIYQVLDTSNFFILIFLFPYINRKVYQGTFKKLSYRNLYGAIYCSATKYLLAYFKHLRYLLLNNFINI